MKNLVFKNKIFTKSELKRTMYHIFTEYGLSQASLLADDLKSLGFRYATQAGISISVEDLKITPTKSEILNSAILEIENSNHQYKRGEISTIERFQHIINVWNNTSESLKNSLVDYFSETDPLNSIYLMAFSGARGNLSQVRQLVGMRGLMSDPNGQIIDIPIIHNFREGLTITDYIMSSYGARKGVVDTALKTADSGYLTRRLVDVSQDVIIREFDCNTSRSVLFDFDRISSKLIESKLVGRTCARKFDYYSSRTKKWQSLDANTQITKAVAQDLKTSGSLSKLFLRSPLTCALMRSVCQRCYGWNLASASLVNLGDAIGILAAQSIGEPGTQLTMRTFHTGGIFTADPSRQIRAQVSGLLLIPSELNFKWARTTYGLRIRMLNNDTAFTLVSYTNQYFAFNLPTQSSLFVEPNQCVKKNALIGELPLTSQQLLKSKKDILAPISGRVIPCKSDEVVWILQGQVYDTPYQSFLNVFQNYKVPLTAEDIITSYKFTSSYQGIVKLHLIDQQVQSLQVLNGVGNSNEQVFFDRRLNLCCLITSDLKIYEIPSLYFTTGQSCLKFSAERNIRYFVPTNGSIYAVNYANGKSLSTSVSNTRILYVPDERYKINRDRSLLMVYPGTEISEPNTEFVKGRYARYSGVVQIQESEEILQQIRIKPGKFVEYVYLKPKDVHYLMSLHNKIFYPGEVLFDEILIEHLSLVEFISTSSTVGLLIRPLLDYNVPKFLQSSITSFSNPWSLDFIKQTSILNSDFSLSSSKTGSYLLKNEYILSFVDSVKCKFVKLQSEFASLVFVNDDLITFRKVLPKQFELDQTYLNLNVENLQFVDRNSVLGYFNTRLGSNIANHFETLSVQKKGFRKVLFTLNSDYISYYNEYPIFKFPISKFIKKGDKVAKNYLVPNSGYVLKSSPFDFTLHKGNPIFFKNDYGIKLTKNKDSFVKTGELLGVIHYNQIITGDIVQGLPKIEEILEARRPMYSASLATAPGIITSIQILNKVGRVEIKTVGRLKQVIEVALNNSNLDLVVNKNNYISVGQPLTAGAINPHDLLEVFFNFYKNYNIQSKAAYLSFKNLQVLLINKVQQVYNSQGVDIADKHLEIIIRQMTSKVLIVNPGSTLLVENELLDFCQVLYINKVMALANRFQAQYSPRLLGITKASLLTDSFISAASFQETTKILTAAAIEGKVDWLRGLKENVIIGRLIPVGKGFSPNLESDKEVKQLTFY